MDELNQMLAQNVYDSLCSTLDSLNWHYTKNEEELSIYLTVTGDDIPMNFLFAVEAERQLLRVISPLSFKVPEDKRVEAALAVCAANYGMLDGNFDYDISTGVIAFRMCASFRSSLIGEGLIRYLVACSGSTVDKYNDRFLALSKGMLSLEDFLAQE